MKRRSVFPLLAGTALAGAAAGAGSWLRSPWLRSQDFLLGCQSGDGAWRSSVYGAFKDGRGLTPLVLRALGGSHRAEVRRACRRAARWLVNEGGGEAAVFPVHGASWLLQTMAHEPSLEPLREGLRKQLQGLQMGSKRGWERADACFGGWSYGHEPVSKAAGRELAAMQQPNLSATVIALSGLGGGSARYVQEGRVFIERCQNFSGQPGPHDDGGFYQMGEDPTRNKAGVAGRDVMGRRRFRSYTSATADGLRGLLLAGAGVSDPRVQAAVRWLAVHPLDDVPDLVFYASYARTAALRHLEKRGGRLPPWREGLAKLEQFRAPDGSYHNPAGEMRENDPVVATALALMAGRMSGVV